MSYALFDLLALALPACLLLRGARGRGALTAPVAAMSLLALLWTAPWDEHLVLTSVWTYDAGGVLARVGAVPVEEYVFVVLQVLLVGAWALRARALLPPDVEPVGHPPTRHRGGIAWAAVAVVGLLLLLAGGHVRYLGLLLVWAAPPLALQSAVAGDVLAGRRAERLRVVVPAALWLCAADRLALAGGVWSIAPASSTGWAVLGLPVEEAVFFALTCLLVSDGLLLAADPGVLRRCAALVRICMPHRDTTSPDL